MFWNILLNGNDFVYNIGGIHTLSILEIANIIGDILDKNILISDTNNELEGNPKFVNLSIQKYIDEFGKSDFVSLKDGLNRTINWHKQLSELISL
jgi:nucleoside-diphosphate-sugar epimerase